MEIQHAVLSCCYVACVGYRHPFVICCYIRLENNAKILKKNMELTQINNKNVVLTLADINVNSYC